mmetsp:Transcript_10216/g.22660  ORF Transcript_10216/g.22660 Transcript_10216/m.22660 type:complete len:580 (-) Transcript_10216:493-2232(-)|eukprot:CAMPEP_0113313042 /NCGR_PEP_ID=MMETSP0010_2-20120614/9622_1 /TAXON_ID=216773 ORGANISM="Corethron hystrix, Strain 308" /NCGR_SAMPLE_ID=MMETSP0010_2 /ASSEMBLY_ACC=CAM_ASM_000155 /LENGTH=579 /DNA_ID=CAMNT_0000168971 /DNA_START=88 /DNA_END=1827 /DNA_ORIENTATION=+ /assembly_acc=CAM_ASM_000155
MFQQHPATPLPDDVKAKILAFIPSIYYTTSSVKDGYTNTSSLLSLRLTSRATLAAVSRCTRTVHVVAESPLPMKDMTLGEAQFASISAHTSASSPTPPPHGGEAIFEHAYRLFPNISRLTIDYRSISDVLEATFPSTIRHLRFVDRIFEPAAGHKTPHVVGRPEVPQQRRRRRRKRLRPALSSLTISCPNTLSTRSIDEDGRHSGYRNGADIPQPLLPHPFDTLPLRPSSVPSLRRLAITSCRTLSDRHVHEICRTLTSLTHLDISDSGSALIRPVVASSSLEDLIAGRCAFLTEIRPVPDGDIEINERKTLSFSCPRLKTLDLGWNRRISSDVLHAVLYGRKFYGGPTNNNNVGGNENGDDNTSFELLRGSSGSFAVAGPSLSHFGLSGCAGIVQLHIQSVLRLHALDTSYCQNLVELSIIGSGMVDGHNENTSLLLSGCASLQILRLLDVPGLGILDCTMLSSLSWLEITNNDATEMKMDGGSFRSVGNLNTLILNGCVSLKQEGWAVCPEVATSLEVVDLRGTSLAGAEEDFWEQFFPSAEGGFCCEVFVDGGRLTSTSQSDGFWNPGDDRSEDQC